MLAEAFPVVWLSVAFAAGLVAVHNLGVTLSDVQASVDSITEQVLKSRLEVLAKIAELEAAAAAGEVVDFTELKAAVQSVDDIVADVVVADPETAVSE